VTAPDKKYEHHILSSFLSDMALFVLCGSSSSFSTRFYILALIALVLVCFCTYCSSSPIAPSLVDTDQFSDEINEFNKDDDIVLGLPSDQYISEQAILPTDDRLLAFLLQAAINEDHHQQQARQNSKRYASQSFHAMRG
jgi:hypothetical protein